MGVEKSVKRVESAEKKVFRGLSTVFLRVLIVFCTVLLDIIITPGNELNENS